MQDWLLNANCEKAALKPLAVDSVLNAVAKQPGQDIDKVSSLTALTGAPAFLNFIPNLISLVGATGFPAGPFQIQQLLPGKIHYGRFLLASPFSNSANTGFNFSPARDMSEAIFWNPSAIANARKPYNISLLTNLKNNTKIGGFLRLNEKISLGGGFIYTKQDEFRNTIFRPPVVDTNSMYLKEFAAFLSPVYKVSSKFSVAITLKSVWQNFNNPDSLLVSDDGKSSRTTDINIRKQHFDADVSATYKFSNSFQAGISLMHLAGTKLYADAFVPSQTNVPMQNQRSLGLGLTYKWQRFNAGADILFTADGFYDASFGVNYVPFNNALLSAGIAVKQLSYSFAFRIKYFRIAYIDDNGFLVGEKRKSKHSILNGRIYGGFIFDLK
jgi:hypothetical protein